MLSADDEEKIKAEARQHTEYLRERADIPIKDLDYTKPLKGFVERHLPNVFIQAGALFSQKQKTDSYILYYRYCTMVVQLQKQNPDYKSHNPKEKEQIRKNLDAAMARLEKLQEEIRADFVTNRKADITQQMKRKEAEEAKRKEEEARKLEEQAALRAKAEQQEREKFMQEEARRREEEQKLAELNARLEEERLKEASGLFVSNPVAEPEEDFGFQAVPAQGQEEGSPELLRRPRLDDSLPPNPMIPIVPNVVAAPPPVAPSSTIHGYGGPGEFGAFGDSQLNGSSFNSIPIAPPVLNSATNSALPQSFSAPQQPYPMPYQNGTQNLPPFPQIPPPSAGLYSPYSTPPTAVHTPPVKDAFVFGDETLRPSAPPLPQHLLPTQPPPANGSTVPTQTTNSSSSLIPTVFSIAQPEIPVAQPSAPPSQTPREHIPLSLQPITPDFGGDSFNAFQQDLSRHNMDIEMQTTGLKKMFIPGELIDEFVQLAKPNTRSNRETCGLLMGVMSPEGWRVTHLFLPPQKGSSDNCETYDEMKVFNAQIALEVVTLGWIHTHPTQTNFLSSIDLHTQYTHQLMLPEAVAIVIAPTDKKSVAVYTVPVPEAMAYLGKCRLTGFHEHRGAPELFKDAKHAQIAWRGEHYEVLDMR